MAASIEDATALIAAASGTGFGFISHFRNRKTDRLAALHDMYASLTGELHIEVVRLRKEIQSLQEANHALQVENRKLSGTVARLSVRLSELERTQNG